MCACSAPQIICVGIGYKVEEEDKDTKKSAKKGRKQERKEGERKRAAQKKGFVLMAHRRKRPRRCWQGSARRARRDAPPSPTLTAQAAQCPSGPSTQMPTQCWQCWQGSALWIPQRPHRAVLPTLPTPPKAPRPIGLTSQTLIGHWWCSRVGQNRRRDLGRVGAGARAEASPPENGAGFGSSNRD